jgi:hypothetical protein
LRDEGPTTSGPTTDSLFEPQHAAWWSSTITPEPVKRAGGTSDTLDDNAHHNDRLFWRENVTAADRTLDDFELGLG